jgi:hypothetical protein
MLCLDHKLDDTSRTITELERSISYLKCENPHLPGRQQRLSDLHMRDFPWEDLIGLLGKYCHERLSRQ